MSLRVEIEVPTDKALPAIAKVQAELGKVEGAAPRLGAALGGALGQGAAGADRARAAVNALTTAFAPLTAQWQREAAILDRVNGPLREYTANLQAADMLQQKGQLTTAQYVDQVTRLNRELDRAQARPGVPERGGEHEATPFGETGIGQGIEALASRGGEAGEVLGGLATKGTVAAASIVGLGFALAEAGDKYGELANSVQRFTSSGVSADDVLHQQLDLAGQLHARLDTTIELYRGVNEAAKPLLMTQKEQLDLTRNLGAIATENNKPFAAMGELLQRLQYAAEGGTLSGRELKSMMQQNNDIANIWTGTLGKTRNELIDLADAGKLNITALVTAIGSSKEPLEKMGQQTETLGQQWGHFKDRVDLAVGSWVSGVGKGLAAMQQAAGDLKAHPAEALNDMANSGDPFGLGKSIEALTGVKTQAIGATDALAKAKATDDVLTLSVSAVADGFERFEKQLEKNKRAVTELDEFTKKLLDTLHSADLKRVTDEFAQFVTNISKPLAGPDALAGMNAILGPVAKAKHDLAELNAALKADPALNTDKTSDQQAALLEQITGAHNRERDILLSIVRVRRDYNADIAATNDLYRRGSIGALDYADKLHTLWEGNPLAAELTRELDRQVAEYDRLAKAAAAARDAQKFGVASPGSLGLTGVQYAQSQRDAASDYTTLKGGDAAAAAEFNAREAQQAQLLSQIVSPAERYQKALNSINEAFPEGSREGGIYNSLLTDLREKYADAYSPTVAYHKELRDLESTTKIASLTNEEHAAAVDKIRLAYLQAGAEGKTFAGGAERAFLELKNEINDVGTLTEKTLLDAFKGLEDGIIASANAGKLNFSSLIDSMLADLERLAAREIELGLISLFTGGGVGGAAAGAIIPGVTGPVTSPSQISARGAPSLGLPGAPDSVSARGAPIVLQVHNHYDPHELLSAVDSRQGNAAVLNVLRANPAAVQSYTGTGRRGRGR